MRVVEIKVLELDLNTFATLTLECVDAGTVWRVGIGVVDGFDGAILTATAHDHNITITHCNEKWKT